MQGTFSGPNNFGPNNTRKQDLSHDKPGPYDKKTASDVHIMDMHNAEQSPILKLNMGMHPHSIRTSVSTQRYPFLARVNMADARLQTQAHLPHKPCCIQTGTNGLGLLRVGHLQSQHQSIGMHVQPSDQLDSSHFHGRLACHIPAMVIPSMCTPCDLIHTSAHSSSQQVPI